MSPQPLSIDVSQLIERNRLGTFQLGIFVLCAMCLIMDGFDVQALGYLAPAIIKDWRLEPAQMGVVLSAALFGILVGSLLFGAIADRVGRRPVLIFTTLAFGIVTLLTARAQTLGELRLLRFIAGVGLGGIMPNAVALVGEYTPQRLRVATILVVTNGFNIGAMAGGFLSAWLVQDYGWRSVFYVGGAIPLVVGALMLVGLPESLQFLVLRGGSAAKIAATVRRIDPAAAAAADGGTRFTVHEEPRRGAAVLRLFADGRAVGTLLLWVVNFMNLLNLYFLAGWLPTIVSSSYTLRASQLVGTMLQIGGVLGTFVFSWLIGRLGYIPVLATAFFTACVTIALIGQPALALAILFAVVFIAGFCVVGSQGAINALAAAYYPTQLRSTGVGAGLGVGRVGGIVGPYVAGAFVGAGFPPRDIFYAAAVPALISAITICALRFVMRPSKPDADAAAEAAVH